MCACLYCLCVCVCIRGWIQKNGACAASNASAVINADDDDDDGVVGTRIVEHALSSFSLVRSFYLSVQSIKCSFFCPSPNRFYELP